MNARRTRVVDSFLTIVALVVLAWPAWSVGQTFTSGSTGADGPFNPPTTVPPGTTVTGSIVTVPLPPTGIYNFTTITIPAGVTVTFTKNAANTPGILLAQGAVTLNGTLDVSGGSAGPLGRPGAGGPGGFDGGVGADGITTGVGGSGLGPGGGGGGGVNQNCGGGGGYTTAGSPGCGNAPGAAGPAYGTPALQPILGGSGGGGAGGAIGNYSGGGGGGGGGALLLASSTSITLGTSSSSVVLRANGGAGSNGQGSSGPIAFDSGGGGSGGAIRLIAPTLTGVGQLVAQGGAGGAAGRIRLEASTLTYTGSTTPLASTAFPLAVFPPAGQPTLTIASIGGIAAPAMPSGSFLAAPDVLLPVGTTNPVPVVLTAGNIPLGTTIQVTATPQSGSKTSALSSGLAGTLASSTATANISLNLTQTSVLTATATFPLVASAGSGPIYADGEEVTHIKVAAVLGGGSSLTYITRSGREVRIQ